MILIGLSLLIAILLCVHVVRTGREMFWLWIILGLQPLGGVVYFVINVLPQLAHGPTARSAGNSVRQALDPTREYREATAACDDTPTVRNQSRLAAASSHLGHHAEAEALYRQAACGVHAEDPVLLLGHAKALLELDRPDEALTVLEKLGQDEAYGRTAEAALALGRTYEALGRITEADTALQWASQRLPGFEGLGRYAAFMARHGRRAEAKEAVDEMDKRLLKLKPQFRKEGRLWRDLAAEALGHT